MQENNENNLPERRTPKFIYVGTNKGYPAIKNFICNKCEHSFNCIEIKGRHKAPARLDEIENYGKCPKCGHSNRKVLILDVNDEYGKEIDKLPKVTSDQIKNWVHGLVAERERRQNMKNSLGLKPIVLDDTPGFIYHSPLSKPEPTKWYEFSKYIKIFKP